MWSKPRQVVAAKPIEAGNWSLLPHATANQPPTAKRPAYQLDFTTPGNFPCDAKSRKQIRQMPNFRMKPLGRPQIGHRL